MQCDICRKESNQVFTKSLITAKSTQLVCSVCEETFSIQEQARLVKIALLDKSLPVLRSLFENKKQWIK